MTEHGSAPLPAAAQAAVLVRARRRLRPGARLRLGAARVRRSAWAIGQSALGGAIAWELAARLLGHPAPFFAPTAAIVCLSISARNRLRRVGELALGVTIGVGLGELLVHEIGRGGWQLGLVVLAGMSVALLLDGGVLIVNQAALQAVFVTALPTAPPGGYVGRWTDALLGSAIALAIAFLLPADPLGAMRESAGQVVAALAGALRTSARAARTGDADAAFAALEQARATQPVLQRWDEAVGVAEDISRLSPLRRRAEGEILTHRRSTSQVDRAVRNVRVALRRMVAAVEDAEAGAPAPPAVLLDRLDELARALYTLPGLLRDPDGEGGRRARAALEALAGRLDPQRLPAPSMSSTVVLAQLRSTVVDLLQLTGLSAEQARARLAS